MRKPAASFAPETERILRAYDYPGNVRELRNLIERAVILSTRRGRSIAELHRARPAPTRAAAPRGAPRVVLRRRPRRGRQAARARRRWNARYIARLLEFTGGNRTQVARLLGVSYPTIAKKIADYGLWRSPRWNLTAP